MRYCEGTQQVDSQTTNVDLGLRHLHDWTQHPIAAALLLVVLATYFTGRARLAPQDRPARYQVAVFVLGFVCLWLAFASPLAELKFHYLYARTLQQALAGIVAPPLLLHGRWLDMLWHLVPADRQNMLRTRWRGPSLWWMSLRWATGPGPVWLLTVGLFALWHDSATVNWLMERPRWANASLTPFWAAFMMFWWHAMAAPPHLHRPLPVWLRFVFLIVGGEVANMITGVTLAFRQEATYSYYLSANSLERLTAVQDQMISGGIIWVTGSFIYIGVAVALLGQVLVRRRFEPHVPPRDWQTATLLTIAPGLEDRVGEQPVPKPAHRVS